MNFQFSIISNFYFAFKKAFSYFIFNSKSLLLNDHSYAGEFSKVNYLLSKIGINSGYIIDIAASDGITQSCTFGFFSDSHWQGLAIEVNSQKFSRLSYLYSNNPQIGLAKCRVTPDNVSSIFSSFSVPVNFDFLNLDIDSFDLHVIISILDAGYLPKLISIEINEKIPPPLFFSVNYIENYSWNYDHFYGCSLEAACLSIKPYGYILESLHYNNAMFVRSDIAQGIFTDLDSADAYLLGYQNKPDRLLMFPCNVDFDELFNLSHQDAIEFINHKFIKYKGMYFLR